MVNMSASIEAKSSQLNADDLIGKTITIVITKVSGTGDAQQPIAIHYDGDNGKPFMPCKTVRRILVHVWGVDGTKYVSRSMTLYRDDKVKFGGIEVGGIRISHMSDIDKPVTLALTASKANKKPFTVQPLKATVEKSSALSLESAEKLITEAANSGFTSLSNAWKKLTKEQQAHFEKKKDELKVIASAFDAVNNENKKEVENA